MQRFNLIILKQFWSIAKSYWLSDEKWRTRGLLLLVILLSLGYTGLSVLLNMVGTLITVGVFGKPLVRLNFEQLKKEADFRFSLVRVRENAEAIAFYQGEQRESDQIKGRLNFGHTQ